MTSVAPHRPIIPLLLAGTPDTAFPPGLPADLRYHDLGRATWLGVMQSAGRDELLRVTALLSGAELRELINWNRRRLLLQGAGALAVSLPVAGTGLWLLDQATRIRPADVSARVAYTWVIGEVEDGQHINDLLSKDATLTLRAVRQLGEIRSPWPKRKPGILTMPDLIHYALLDWLARDDQIDWSRAVVDTCCIRAVYGGDQTGPNPTDRAKRGSLAVEVLFHHRLAFFDDASDAVAMFAPDSLVTRGEPLFQASDVSARLFGVIQERRAQRCRRRSLCEFRERLQQLLFGVVCVAQFVDERSVQPTFHVVSSKVVECRRFEQRPRSVHE
jgi:hypothetical protein